MTFVDDDAEHGAAAAIADGEGVDWMKNPTLAEDEREGLVLVERIAQACRRVNHDFDEADLFVSRPREAVEPIRTTGRLATWGSFRILEPLGKGSYGDVYRAYDPNLRSDVALKLLREETDRYAADQFLDEARRLARIRHPNVLVVHGADRHDGRVGIWTELIRGQTLEDALARQGRLGAREAAVVGVELCRALAAIHAGGLVHRDVKTTNVMREEGGRIVLMDFGAMAEVAPSGTPAASGDMQGSPLTMAPEQIEGGVASPSTDIYALGVLLYRLVTGRFPIEAATFDELMSKHRARAIVPLRDRRPDLAPEFVQIVDRCLDADPSRRFPSAGALEQALVGAGAVGGRAPTTTMRRRFPWPESARARAATVAVAAAVAVVAGFAVTRSPDRNEARNPAVSATPSVPATVSPASLTGRATLYRATAGAEELLTPGSPVSVGDRLMLDFEASGEAHVYILDEDETGAAFILFPVAGLEKSNPLPGGILHRLPGSREGRATSWEVTSAGGTESILVLASRSPILALDQDIAAAPPGASGDLISYPRVSDRAKVTLRGIGRIADDPGAEAGVGRGRIAEMFRHASGAGSAGDDVWVWQTEVVSHGP